jgi:hypothetical protein
MKTKEESLGGKAFRVSEFNHICPPVEDELLRYFNLIRCEDKKIHSHHLFNNL